MIRQRLFKAITMEIDGKYLAIFRMMMGLVLLKESYRIYKSIFPFYLEPDLQIKWPFLEWLPLFPEKVLYSAAGLIGICGFFILIGLFSRLASAIAVVAYGYFLFLDCSYYNNHYYLIFLILIIFSVCSQDQKWSVSEKLFHFRGKVPAWNIGLLRFQIAIVYLFGGFAKLNKDWLSGNTMKASIEAGAYKNIIEAFPGYDDIVVLVLTHGGWLFDIIVPVLLLLKATRWWIIPVIVVFHVLNIFSLNIGVFPYMMLGSTVLFFGEGIAEQYRRSDLATERVPLNRYVLSFVIVYMLFQLLFPMRHFLLNGDYNITGEGYNFSWKMKGNAVELKQYDFFLIDISKNDTLKIETNLHQKQFNRLYLSPSSNIYIAHYFKNKFVRDALYQESDLAANVHVKVIINGGDSRYLIDNQFDILKMNYSSVNQFGKIIIY